MRVSLAQTGYWLRGLGQVDGMECPDPGFDEVSDRLEETPSGFGRLTGSSPCRRDVRNAMLLGAHERSTGHACTGLAPLGGRLI